MTLRLGFVGRLLSWLWARLTCKVVAVVRVSARSFVATDSLGRRFIAYPVGPYFAAEWHVEEEGRPSPRQPLMAREVIDACMATLGNWQQQDVSAAQSNGDWGRYHDS